VFVDFQLIISEPTRALSA